MTEPSNDFGPLAAGISSIFAAASIAVTDGLLIQRASQKDKEFHFQNWFKALLERENLDFDEPGRNTYPDFRIVHSPVGYEIKGLGVPGRVANYDCNSQIPHGVYRGRHIVYVFGRYPAKPETNKYPVFDLILCHGSFLNADTDYIHENKSILGMGSYGDIRLRDRKMYVAPTPYGLLDGVERQVTLILPDFWPINHDNVVARGSLTRVEAGRIMCGYTFNLTTNHLEATWRENPNAGREYGFTAYRLTSSPGPEVRLR